MIPSDIRLFTWLDVEDVIADIREGSALPTWFLQAQAYWDGLTITVQSGRIAEAAKWANEVFDPRIGEHDGQLKLTLESLPGKERYLPIRIEESTAAPSAPSPSPTFSRPTALSREVAGPPSETSADKVPILVFHSFKGGVGRTTHAIVTALTVSQTRRVMLVDGDFEAPGITWLLRGRLPSPPISFADILAMAHGDPTPDADETLSLASDRLQGASFDNCVFVPAFRSTNSLHPVDIRPEHLGTGRQDTFFLNSLIWNLAKRANVDLVIIDLRAGFSELSAGFLLDPRIYRVFVTNLNGQSLHGTRLLMEYIAKRAASATELEPYPAVAVTQIPENYEQERLSDELTPLLAAWQDFVPSELRAEANPAVELRSGFDRTLQALPADWTTLTTAVRRSEAFAQASTLMNWLPLAERTGATVPAPNSIKELRRTLASDAGRRIFAEKGGGDDFLDTPAIGVLAEDHLRAVPVSVVVGAKGAGKTLTFITLAKLKSWNTFTRKVLNEAAITETEICPVLLPISLDSDLTNEIIETRRTIADTLGGVSAIEYTRVRDYLTQSKTELSNESEWRDAWLNAIAWSAGLTSPGSYDGKTAIGRFSAHGKRLVAIFDGLEDLFQEIATDPKQQIAVRALVQEVPLWLSQLPSGAVGLIVFIRRDLVEFAVRQNLGQLLDRYKPYALNWDRAEALRLTYWLAWKAGVLDLPRERLARLAEEEAGEMLLPLWGKKLGSDKSRDARTAVWVLDALSEFNGQVQARDLVRFVHFAARDSIEDTKWTDRILTPGAIRASLPPCSEAKVRETRDENVVLREIFNKVERIPADQRKAPFQAEFGNLTAEDLTILQQNGIITLDRDSYYVAEIYLHGLGFSYDARGRRRVMPIRR